MQPSIRLDWSKTLLYRDGRKWSNLPTWATSLIDIGWTVGGRPATEERLSIAIVVPDRRFAAALLALGYILAQPVPFLSTQDLDRHFNSLLALPDPNIERTLLVYLLNGRSINGFFDGVCETEGVPRLRLRVQERSSNRSGGGTYFIDRAQASKLYIASEMRDRLGRNTRGRTLLKDDSFLKKIYDPLEVEYLHIFAHPTVHVVGRLNAFRAEVMDEIFASQDENGSICKGVLNDVIKVDRFSPPSLRPLTRLTPSAHENIEELREDFSQSLVILDGSDSYMKWSHAIKKSDMISVFCYTDSQIDEAAISMNERYAVRLEKDDKILSQIIELRGKLDGVAFWEKD